MYPGNGDFKPGTFPYRVYPRANRGGGDKDRRSKVKSIIQQTLKDLGRRQADTHAAYTELAQQGKVTRRRTNGSYYVVG